MLSVLQILLVDILFGATGVEVFFFGDAISVISFFFTESVTGLFNGSNHLK